MLDLRRIHESIVRYADATYHHVPPYLNLLTEPHEGAWFASGKRSLFVASGSIGTKFFIFGDHPAEQCDVNRIQRVHDVLARHGLAPRAYLAVEATAVYPSDPRPAGSVLMQSTRAAGPTTCFGLKMEVAEPVGLVQDDEAAAFRERLLSVCKECRIGREGGTDAIDRNLVKTRTGISLVDVDVRWKFYARYRALRNSPSSSIWIRE